MKETGIIDELLELLACYKHLTLSEFIMHWILEKEKNIYSDINHYEKVKENRNIFKRLIDVVAFLRTQKSAFRSAWGVSRIQKQRVVQITLRTIIQI